MKTLWDKLRTEHKDNMNQVAKKHPYSIETIQVGLQKCNYHSEILLETGYRMQLYLGIKIEDNILAFDI